MYRSLRLALLLLLVSIPATAKDEQFAQCLRDLTSQAIATGIPAETAQTAIGQAQQLTRVIKADRNQAEFVESFATYLNKRVTTWRVQTGQRKLQAHQAFLNRLQQQYGVPGHYLVAFWGLETNFGTYKGKIPTFDALTTLACDPRRSTYFTQELFAALRILDEQQLEPANMLGSWAGAMGHTQFMPSNYLRYAIDGDGDQQIDLFNNERDALASAANFLHNLGWQRGYRWGRQVLLPSDFDYQLVGLQTVKTVTAWGQLGVTTRFGQALPAAEISASLIVPAGHQGPAFLVYENFHVTKRWNNSNAYAIAVGQLAMQLQGSPAIDAQYLQHEGFKISRLKALQQILKDQGLLAGPVDGIFGSMSRRALQQWQQANQFIADGYPNEAVFRALAIE